MNRKQNLYAAFIVMCAVFLLLGGCGKEKIGPIGPAGAAGAQGPAGNANIIQYEFTNQKITNGLLNLQLYISQAVVDKSVILIYYNPIPEASTAWYPVPGLGSGASYQIRYLVYQASPAPSMYTVSLRAAKPDGTSYNTLIELRKVRIIFAESTQVINAVNRGVNLNNFIEASAALQF